MYDLYPEWGPAKHRTEEPAMDAGSARRCRPPSTCETTAVRAPTTTNVLP